MDVREGDITAIDADAIVTSALGLLDETGVGGFTIRALADRLDVSAPTIYWHVGSKAKLMELIVDRVVADLAVERPLRALGMCGCATSS